MLSGCHSGSALCATCSFCMRLAHSRAGCKDRSHHLGIGWPQTCKGWQCSSGMQRHPWPVQRLLFSLLAQGADLGNGQAGETAHSGKHIRIRSAERQVI